MEYRTTVLRYNPASKHPEVNCPVKPSGEKSADGKDVLVADESWLLVTSCASWDPIHHHMVIVWTWERPTQHIGFGG